jgi:hypothetical protein
LEQEEFRELWARAGVEATPGDGYYLCPFHDDHHPSLHIDVEGCRWYCFACRIGGGIGRLSRELGITRPRAPSQRVRGKVGRARRVTVAGEVPVDVVGESFHQEELLRIAGGRRPFGGVDLEMVTELVPMEGDGIEVRVGGSSIGYLRHEDAEHFATLVADRIDLTEAATCRAVIRGGWDRGGGDIGMFGVTLLLPQPDLEEGD